MKGGGEGGNNVGHNPEHRLICKYALLHPLYIILYNNIVLLRTQGYVRTGSLSPTHERTFQTVKHMADVRTRRKQITRECPLSINDISAANSTITLSSEKLNLRITHSRNTLKSPGEIHDIFVKRQIVRQKSRYFLDLSSVNVY